MRRFIEAARCRRPIRADTLAALVPAQRELFLSMDPADQRHALRVHDALLRAGYVDPVLLEAALLHDCGKAWPRPRLWVRVLVDIGESLAPTWLQWLERRRWPLGRAVHAYRLHTQLGARASRLAGSSARVVALIRDCGVSPRPKSTASPLRVANRRAEDERACHSLTRDPLADILRRFDSAF